MILAQATAMALPVFNTFIHFAVSQDTRRCRSAPPEFQVNLTLASNPSKRTRRRRRQQPAQDDEATFSEFRALAIWEKWRMLAQKLETRDRKLCAETRDLMIALKAFARLPEMQETIPTDLFMHTVNSLSISFANLTILFCEGVLRRNGDAVEIWAAEDPAPEIKLLLAHARCFKRLLDRGEFVMRIPMGEGFACCTMPLGDEMTAQDLKAVAAVCCGILSEKLKMTHLSEELTPPGLLVEKGVVPGSCIIISKIMER